MGFSFRHFLEHRREWDTVFRHFVEDGRNGIQFLGIL